MEHLKTHWLISSLSIDSLKLTEIKYQASKTEHRAFRSRFNLE